MGSWVRANQLRTERTLRQTHCKHGHEIAIVGRNASRSCKACGKASHYRWRQRYPLKSATYARKVGLLKKYGITLEQYAAMLEKRGGGCAICGGTSQRRPLDVDHNHQTRVVRGLLCSPCNVLIGFAKENVERLAQAADYLRRYR